MKEKKEAFRFNYKYIKDNTTMGNWRRGYEASKTDIILETKEGLAGIEAKIKGNFKDHYDTSLSFTKNSVHAECSCPVKDEWCKHAIAVGLEAIECGLFQEYYDKKTKKKLNRNIKWQQIM